MIKLKLKLKFKFENLKIIKYETRNKEEKLRLVEFGQICISLSHWQKVQAKPNVVKRIKRPKFQTNKVINQ